MLTRLLALAALTCLLLLPTTGHAASCSECGAAGQRACCAFPLDGDGIFSCGPACESGVLEVFGGSGCAFTSCIDPPCGGEGERACCLNEQVAAGVDNCDDGLIELVGCAGNCDCKGLLAFDLKASGTCYRPSPCGGEGERACCFAENVLPCDLGLTPVPGCTGDCFCGGSETGVVDDDAFGLSTTSCVKVRDIAEPSINGTPAAPPAECSVRGYADLHMHLFADIAHGGGVLAGAPCPTDSTTYCSEAFAPGQLAKDECSKSYCDLTGTYDVNDAIGQCFGTDRDLVTKTGGTLANPDTGLCGVGAGCPCWFDSCGQSLMHGHHTLFDDAVGSELGTLDGAASNFGASSFTAWPQWSTTTHQQVYYKWLERAWRGGLRLMVQMAVTNTALCKTNKHLTGIDCDDSMAFVDQQLQAAYDFEEFVDSVNGGDGWFRIVLTPQQARKAMGEGKMAVVLGIEVDHLFNCKFPRDECTFTEETLTEVGNLIVSCNFTEDTDFCRDPNDPTKTSKQWVQEQVDHYHDHWGVRHMFPIHNFDNSFGGTATWQSAIEVGNRFIAGHWYGTRECGPENYGFKLGQEGALIQFLAGQFGFNDLINIPARGEDASCNFLGITPLGEVLVKKMMNKGMIIDVDHMSTRTLDDTIFIAQQRGGYPLVASHAQLFDLNKKSRRHERMRTAAQLTAMDAMGSMLGVMLKDDLLDTDARGDRLSVDYAQSGITDNCRHSSKTFAQMYTYAVDKMGGRVGMGSDFNGVAGHFGPRFGSDACGGDAGERSRQLRANNKLAYPFTLDQFGTFSKQKSGPKTFDYNTIGMAHVGLLPDFVADLQAIGLSDTDLDPLFRSAEEYVKLWERARGETVRDGCFDCRDEDGTPPVLTCPADLTTECTGVTTSVAFSPPSATEECSVASTATCAPISNSGFPVGSSVVTCSAQDESSNTGTCSMNVVVRDTGSPTMAAPADLVAVECTSAAGASPGLGAATATDLCDAAPAVTNDAPDTFPLGQTTTVVWTATDGSSNSDTASQDVTVVDTTPPGITAPAALLAVECTSAAGASPALGTPTVADTCDTSPAVANDAPPVLPLRQTTTVTWTATDDNTNVNSATQEVAVVDTTAPSITCPPGIVAEAGGSGFAVVAVGTATGADVCGAVAFTHDAPASFPLGFTTVTHTATDDQGLESSCVQTVQIERAPLDHFMCHHTRRFPSERILDVALDDVVFGPYRADVRDLQRLCNPASKNGEDPDAVGEPVHLAGYDLKRVASFPRFERGRNVRVVNQFHPDGFIVDIVKPDMLLVPTAKGVGAAPAPLVDPAVGHFKCYHVKRRAFRVEDVMVEDQFFPSALGPRTDSALTVDVKKLTRLCVATDKNGEGVATASAHLLCYKTRNDPRKANIESVLLDNQFGEFTVDVAKTGELCVPTAINPACGNGIVDLPYEECDGAANAVCAGACRPRGAADECTCE